MSEAMNVDTGTPAAAPPPPPSSAERTSSNQPELPDAEIMAIMAKTQNKCFAEMGYYPTLLREFQELQKHCLLLRNDNQKLYSDNRSLAQFIQAQDKRIQSLATSPDQHVRTDADTQEMLRALKAERDELNGRLHAALNEIMILRQELSRFVPSALVLPAHERAVPGPMPQAPQQRVVSTPVAPPVVLEHPSANFGPYHQRPPPPQQFAAHHRPIQPLPPPRMTPHNLSTLETSAPPTISHHRRQSGSVPPNIAGPSSASASPIHNFNGLNIASPTSSRPSTGNASAVASAGGIATLSKAGPVRNIHMIPVHPQTASPSSLAGAIIDLTGDEAQGQNAARKRRKTDHTPEMGGMLSQLPVEQSASPVATSAMGPPAAGHISPSPLNPTPAPAQTPAPSVISSPHPHNVHAPTPPPQYTAFVQPVLTTGSPATSPNPTNGQSHLTNNPPPQAPDNGEATDEQATLEEYCIEANFDEDEEDVNKLWCRMCISRFQKGHTTDQPSPFVSATREQLVGHCKTVHPRGWEVLKESLKAAEMRAEDDTDPV
ncbi:hypothetical protein C8Q78DRAFT_85604 [Trametes maxima]|nr:hypothetical protein C8Q78DRAFT_85604 [Trametes maxima]